MFDLVTPANAGVLSAIAFRCGIPAFAGMTATIRFIASRQPF